MFIQVTARELIELGCWDDFCKYEGYDPSKEVKKRMYQYNEEFTITKHKAKDYGVID